MCDFISLLRIVRLRLRGGTLTSWHRPLHRADPANGDRIHRSHDTLEVVNVTDAEAVDEVDGYLVVRTTEPAARLNVDSARNVPRVAGVTTGSCAPNRCTPGVSCR